MGTFGAVTFDPVGRLYFSRRFWNHLNALFNSQDKMHGAKGPETGPPFESTFLEQSEFSASSCGTGPVLAQDLLCSARDISSSGFGEGVMRHPEPSKKVEWTLRPVIQKLEDMFLGFSHSYRFGSKGLGVKFWHRTVKFWHRSKDRSQAQRRMRPSRILRRKKLHNPAPPRHLRRLT